MSETLLYSIQNAHAACAKARVVTRVGVLAAIGNQDSPEVLYHTEAVKYKVSGPSTISAADSFPCI